MAYQSVTDHHKQHPPIDNLGPNDSIPDPPTLIIRPRRRHHWKLFNQHLLYPDIIVVRQLLWQGNETAVDEAERFYKKVKIIQVVRDCIFSALNSSFLGKFAYKKTSIFVRFLEMKQQNFWQRSLHSSEQDSMSKAMSCCLFWCDIKIQDC